MATRLLVATGSVVRPVEYTFFYPLEEAAWAMDRFIPSSRQPQHWSRNYHGSQERRRSFGRRRTSPDSQDKGTSSYRQGVTLRAEDLLVDGEKKFGSGSGAYPANYLAPRPGDRRAALGGSATELTQCERPKAPLRRSSEGSYALRRKSSSSSNAADDPTSSDPSSSCTTSSSSSSESGCNADSETCNYCRLSESSDAYEGRESSTDDERSSSSSPPKINGECRRLTRALSEDCNPPSRMRPIRRTSPGEYLRHKRNQMEKLRNDRRDSPGRRRAVTFQRCDSDPRLSFRRKDTESPSREVTFASPTRNRIHRSRNRARNNVDSQQLDGAVNKVILPVPPVNAQHFSVADTKKPKKSPLAKNIAERKSRSKERGRGAVCNAEDSTPFLECSASFRCAVCDTDIPFTNCVLCDAEAKRNFFPESLKNESAEIFLLEEELPIQDSQRDFTVNQELNIRTSDSSDDIAQSSAETKELEEFYDRPTPGNIPSPEALKKPLDDKRVKWISKGATHKSFSSGEFHSSRRKSAQLRKYHSEPMPQTEDDATDQYLQEVSEQRPSSVHSQSRAESSTSSSSKSEKKSGYHIVKDSPRKETIEKDPANPCLVCGKTTEDGETKEKTKSRTLSPEAAVQEKSPRKGPIYLKPEFDFEPEIIHKANPLVDEAEVEVIPSAIGAFRRLSEEEFIATLNIHEAAKKGDLHVVKLLTKKDPKQMETVDERGWTPIHLAAAHGHAEVVKYLAMEGAHLAALDPSSYTALHLAAMNGHNSCLEVLLPMGVDVDSVTAEGFTPLHLAVMNGHLDCIQTLLQWGSSLDKRDALGRGVHDMVEEYNLEEVAALLRRFHKQLHNFKHMLDMMHRNEERSTSEIPREFMDILASIAEESGPE